MSLRTLANRTLWPGDIVRINRAARNGIKIPWRAMIASRQTGVPFYVTCAFLEQESGGGANVFGHDPTQFAGAGTVTKRKYLRYKAARHAGKGMQGVGPMQLTWYAFQDRADELGGCWRPYPNLLAGLEHIRHLHDARQNWRLTARDYNGTGPAAERYADQMVDRLAKWKRIILH